MQAPLHAFSWLQLVNQWVTDTHQHNCTGSGQLQGRKQQFSFQSIKISIMYEKEFYLLGSHPSRYTPGERAHGKHCIGGWVGPGTSLEDMRSRKILSLPGLKFHPLRYPDHSQSLFQVLSKYVMTLQKCG
jgi:hypothetical protein